MRDEKEERKKQARSNKQTNKQGKATQHTQGSHMYTFMYLFLDVLRFVEGTHHLALLTRHRRAVLLL